MTTKNTSKRFVYPGRGTQRGATLVVSLIMLVVLTLLVVSGIRSNSVNLRIAGNMQVQEEASAAAQQAIEQFISSAAIFYAPAASSVSVTVGSDNYTVNIATPQCLQIVPAQGYSALIAFPPQDTYWDIASTASNDRTGASITVHQGVKIRLDAGATCP